MSSRKRKETYRAPMGVMGLSFTEPSSKKRKHDVAQNEPDSNAFRDEQSINDIAWKHYLPSTISLKTTDESINTQLLHRDHMSTDIYPQIPQLSNINTYKHRKVLAQVQDILSTEECDSIIHKCTQLKAFQNLRNKYSSSIRKCNRLLAIDKNLSDLLWNRLKYIIETNIIHNHNISTVPLGFGVADNDHTSNDTQWNVTALNVAIRINKYESNNDHFFSYHKDAQFCASADERSLFTLIVYLNDDFDGGHTNFYVPLIDKHMEDKAYTIEEEIAANGGINDGYKCISIEPIKGNGIIFSHDIIHSGTKIITPNKCKYILKTDVIVTRKQKKGFAISTEESIDYEHCLNYFVEAQRTELEGNKQKANELYERSLYLRYLYPNKLISHNKQCKPLKLETDIDCIWLVIFNYCHTREMECISYLFGNRFHDLMIMWRLQYNKYTSQMYADQFIPNLIGAYGCYNVFEFDYDYFMQHESDCCRVSAMYAFYLMSHSPKSKYFIVQYDAHTQQAVAVTLSQLLKDVFYHRQCHGAYFKIKKESEDEDDIKEVNTNIDIDYMSIVHRSQYVGGVALASSNRIYHKTVDLKNVYACSYMHIESNDANLSERIKSIKTHLEESKYLEKTLTHSMVDKLWNCTNVVNDTVNDTETKLKYMDDLEQMKKAHGLCTKSSVFDDRSVECDGDTSSDYDPYFNFEDVADSMRNYNQLIFDFSKYQLYVQKNIKETQCRLCLSLPHAYALSLTEDVKKEDIMYYVVNIGSLYENGKYSLSFNHASCRCNFCQDEFQLEYDCNMYFGYSHMKHIHIATAKTEDNKMRVWVSYNGVSAM